MCALCHVALLWCLLVHLWEATHIVEGAGCETWIVAINSKIPAGRGNKMHSHRVRPEWGSVWAWNEDMKDIFARCLRKIAVQVCIVIIMHSCLISLCIHIIVSLLLQGIWSVILIGAYFCRLKINHDTHEFILESATFANSLFLTEHWLTTQEEEGWELLHGKAKQRANKARG